MNIIITVNDFDPDKGYLEYYLADMLSEKNDVSIVTFKNIQHRINDEKFNLIRLPYILKINQYCIPSPVSIIYCIKLLARERPNVVHCQPLISPLSILFVFLSLFYKYSIVGSYITGDFNLNTYLKKILYHAIMIFFNTFIINNTQTVFVKTNQLKKITSDIFNIPKKMYQIMPLGVDHELFTFDENSRKEIRKQFGVNQDDVLIVYSGKLNRSKDIDVLIQASSDIINSDAKVKLLIIGEGDPDYVNEINQLVSRHGLSNNVIFHPWVHRTYLPKLFSAGDIAVWPGGQSISIVEAASVGLPLIIKEWPIENYAVTENNGYTFEPGNFLQLRDYLNILIYDKKQREKMGQKSRELVVNKLNWDKISKDYLLSYDHAYEERLKTI